MSDDDDQPGANAFHTTRWTIVMQARGDQPEARVALGQLCEAYWTPVFRFLRREGRDEDASRELTQAFFEKLLAGSGVEKANPAKGRFRSYLLGALKHFLADTRRDASRLKRGGGRAPESIEGGGTETSPGLQIADPTAEPTDSYFDHQWALAVVERGIAAVGAYHRDKGKEKQFEMLKPWLIGDTDAFSQPDAAAALGMSTGAVKVAIHRLRERFREAIRDEIAETIGDDNEEAVAAELRYLIEVLA